MHKVLVNRLGGLSLHRKSVVRLTDRPDMTLDVYHGRKTTIQQQQSQSSAHAKCLYPYQINLKESVQDQRYNYCCCYCATDDIPYFILAVKEVSFSRMTQISKSVLEILLLDGVFPSKINPKI